MAIHIEGKMIGTGLKIAIVATRWNDFMGKRMLDGARDALVRHDVDDNNITIVTVPGCFEIGLVANKLATSGKYDAVVCLGVLIRGGTIRLLRQLKWPTYFAKFRSTDRPTTELHNNNGKAAHVHSTHSPFRSDSMKRRSIFLLVVAEVLAMSLWFVSSAILADMGKEAQLPDSLGAWLASAVSFGFVTGALVVSISGLADRFDPRRVFALAAIVAAAANAMLLVLPIGHSATIVARFVTGFCLAGVYPVGMKIAVGWGDKDRGWLVGLLVGGLTLGSAAPHLLAFLGGANWRLTALSASIAALIAAGLVLLTQLGPHHARAPGFDPSAMRIAWQDKRIRFAFGGYLGHMWELYAMWAWVATALAVSYAVHVDQAIAVHYAKLTAFVAIAAGALLCPLAGQYADRVGKAQITIVAMCISGATAIATALAFNGPIALVAALVVLWGMSIIPDSAQFSALIADFSKPEQAGSIMTLQTALGFALSIVTVQLTPSVANLIGWSWVIALLALGPLIGVACMLRLIALTREHQTPRPNV